MTEEVKKDNILNTKKIVSSEINCQGLEAKFNLSSIEANHKTFI